MQRGEKKKRKKEHLQNCKISNFALCHGIPDQFKFHLPTKPQKFCIRFHFTPCQAPKFQIRSNFTWQPDHRIPHYVRFYLAAKPQTFRSGHILTGNQPTKFHTRSNFTWQIGHKVAHLVPLYLATK